MKMKVDEKKHKLDDPYTRATRNLKERNRRRTRIKEVKTTPDITQEELKSNGYCGSKLTGKPGFCRQKAGRGTEHEGIGCCKWHNGRSPTHNLRGYKQEAIFMGAPEDINPVDALLTCIRYTHAEVLWLSEQMALLSDDDWIEHNDILGRQMHIFQRARADAMNRLARYSKDAIALGIAERVVRMAEMYGNTIARMLTGIAQDLNLDWDQKERWPLIVRKHLLLMENSRFQKPEPEDIELKALPVKT